MCVTDQEAFAFRRVKPPTRVALEPLIQTISQRFRRYLERQGSLVWDIDSRYLARILDELSGLDLQPAERY